MINWLRKLMLLILTDLIKKEYSARIKYTEDKTHSNTKLATNTALNVTINEI